MYALTTKITGLWAGAACNNDVEMHSVPGKLPSATATCRLRQTAENGMDWAEILHGLEGQDVQLMQAPCSPCVHSWIMKDWLDAFALGSNHLSQLRCTEGEGLQARRKAHSLCPAATYL